MTQNTFQNGVGNGARFRASEEICLAEGKKGKAVKFSGYDQVIVENADIDFDRHEAFSMSFWLRSHHESSYMGVLTRLPGYEFAVMDGYPTFRLVHALPANLIQVRAEDPLEVGEWAHLSISYDGSGDADGIQFYKNGKKIPLIREFDQLSKGFSQGTDRLTIGSFRDYQTKVKGYGLLDELRIYDRPLSEIEARLIFDPKMDQNLSQAQKLNHFLTHQHKDYLILEHKIKEHREVLFQAEDSLIGAMIMEDLPKERPTYILTRGAYDSPEKQVQRNIPTALGGEDALNPKDRKELAAWLTQTDHPLTARVVVNRFWQMYFGEALVKTPEDFGNQGNLPTHPYLLDWLAKEFIESGWDTKALQKLIVSSATYLQSSQVSQEERANDPGNELLARGPSHRLAAELIRDIALSASGLRNPKIGGPSIKPYQPPGLWEEKGEFSVLKTYIQDHGEKLYRRGMYTFWRRSSPLPSLSIFDAPERDVCQVKRHGTNTPLQALVMLNDPQFVEASRVLAERVLRAGNSLKDQIIMAHRLLTSLEPSEAVINILSKLYQGEQVTFSKNPGKAKKLCQVGEYPRDPALAIDEVAAMTLVCNAIMSFDETLMKR